MIARTLIATAALLATGLIALPAEATVEPAPEKKACCERLSKTEGFSGDDERFPEHGSANLAFKHKREGNVYIAPKTRADECSQSPDGRILVDFSLWEYDSLSPDDKIGATDRINVCNLNPTGTGDCCRGEWINVNGGNELYIKGKVITASAIHGADFRFSWIGDPDDRYLIQGPGEKR